MSFLTSQVIALSFLDGNCYREQRESFSSTLKHSFLRAVAGTENSGEMKERVISFSSEDLREDSKRMRQKGAFQLCQQMYNPLPFQLARLPTSLSRLLSVLCNLSFTKSSYTETQDMTCKTEDSKRGWKRTSYYFFTCAPWVVILDRLT